jgi:hypothetical protein
MGYARHDSTNYRGLCPSPVGRLFAPRASAVPVSELQRGVFPQLPVPLPRMQLRQVALPRRKMAEVQREPEEQKEFLGRRLSLPEEACRQLCHNFRLQSAASTNERRRRGGHRPQGRLRLLLPRESLAAVSYSNALDTPKNATTGSSRSVEGRARFAQMTDCH